MSPDSKLTKSLIHTYCEARWLSGLERRTLNREVLGSNPNDTVSNLGKVCSPHVALVSRDASSISEKYGSRNQTFLVANSRLMAVNSLSVCCFQKKQRVEPLLYMTEWYMCVFTRTLPWASVLRVWDMFFCEGASPVMVIGHAQHLSNVSCPGRYSPVVVSSAPFA